MKGFVLFCLASSSSLQNKSKSITKTKDAIFNKWCTDVGIECSAAEVRTTTQSVAGRGVFSTRDIAEGEEVISIPQWAALTQDNAAGYFPTLREKLVKCRTRKPPRRIKHIWNRIRRKPMENEATADNHWQAELTAYTQAALDVDHPWSTWISQWGRGDPIQTLVDQGDWSADDEATNTAVSNFHNMAPSVPKYKICAAVDIRLQELNEYKERYQNKHDIIPTPNPSLYTTLISRAIGLYDGVTAVLPMHDMINHSTEPNVGLAFAEDGTFKMIATQDIAKDTELFTHYLKYDDNVMRWDEDKATWLLVQWGIPSSPSDYDAVV